MSKRVAGSTVVVVGFAVVVVGFDVVVVGLAVVVVGFDVVVVGLAVVVVGLAVVVVVPPPDAGTHPANAMIAIAATGRTWLGTLIGLMIL